MLIALAAVAIPLLAAGSAHAAMAGANPATTGLLPDLRSAQITGFDASTGATTVQVCFDKQIASVPTASGFLAGNYRQTERAADSATRDANGTCANVVYSSSFLDPQQRPYMHVDADTVANVANGFGNLEDSVALNGANSHNGTRGHSVAPDLEGITINQATLTVNYIMDEPVASASTTAGMFSVTTQNGVTNPNPGGAGTVTTSGNVVSVKYNPGQLGSPGNPVVRGTVRTFAAAREATEGFSATSRQSATAPGTGGQTNNPDLIATTVADDGTTADFTFDENITPAGGSIPAGSFRVTASEGLMGCTNSAALTAADIVNGNTVRVPLDATATNSVFCDGTAGNEYFVWSDVAPGVVVSTTTANANPEAGVPTGGNAGAFANGFTTGPEAFSTAFNTSTGVVSITLDQRFSSFTTGDIFLVDDAGALIPGNPTSVAGAGGPPGPVIAQAQFTPGQVTGAKSLLLDEGAFTTDLGYDNVDQDLAPSAATPKRQVKHGHVVRHKAHAKANRHGTNKRA